MFDGKGCILQLEMDLLQLLSVGDKSVYGHIAPSGGVLQTYIF